MKKIAALLALMIILSSCSALTVYVLGDYLPPLYDIETQSVYVHKINVKNNTTGNVAEFTSAADIDLIRMQFEGIRCATEKAEGEYSPLYEVTFITTDGHVQLLVLSEAEFVIGETLFEAVRFEADLMVLDMLTSK